MKQRQSPNTANACQCSRVTIALNYANLVSCKSPQHSQSHAEFIAFSLSFAFTNFGAMNFYLGFLSIAIAQVICGVIACTLSCIWSVAKNQGETSLSQLHKHAAMSCLSCITCMFGLLMLIWWFVDWCRVLDRAITDSNGHELFYDLY